MQFREALMYSDQEQARTQKGTASRFADLFKPVARWLSRRGALFSMASNF
jgi:hypothetical protein